MRKGKSLSFWYSVYHASVLLCCKFERDRWSQRGVSRQKLLEASGRVGAILTTVASRGCPQWWLYKEVLLVLPYFSLVLPLFHQSRTADWQVSRSLCLQINLGIGSLVVVQNIDIFCKRNDEFDKVMALWTRDHFLVLAIIDWIMNIHHVTIMDVIGHWCFIGRFRGDKLLPQRSWMTTQSDPVLFH